MAEAGIGSEIAGHRLESVAGRGGMGVVYRATQTRLNRTVALKLISADLAGDDSFRERFEHESQIAAQIEHPNVIPLYEAGEADGQLYITMRYVEGTDLRAMIEREGALRPHVAADILAQVCGALDEAHGRGLVHRDIKPANVLIAGTPDQPHAYLTDFGLTKQAATSSGMTKTGMFVGTLDYIAPEQLQGGPVDARADVYALGCMLYQMLTGRVPYPRDSEPAKIWAHMQEPPPSLREVAPHVPEAFDDVIARSMAKSAEDRYPSAGDLARATRAAVQDRQIGDTAERSVAAGPAAPQTQAAASVPTAYAQQPPQPTHAGAQAYPAPPQQNKSRKGLYALIGGTALAAILAFVLVMALAGGDGDSGGNEAGQVVGEPIKLGKGPLDAAFGGGAIWTANLDDNTVTRVDPETSATTNIPVADLFPFEVDFDGNSLYVTGPNEIRKIDPANNEVVGTYTHEPGEITAVAAGEGALWVAHEKSDTVTKVSQQTMAQDGDRIKVGDQPRSVAVGEGGVWVANYGDSTVSKLDPGTTGPLGDPIKLDFQPGGVSVVEGTVYLGTGKGVVEIDPTSLTLGEPVEIRGAGFYDVGLGSLWTTFPNSGQLKRLDLETKAEVGEPIDVGKGVQGVAVGLRGVPDVWVLNTKAATITRVKP